MKESVCHNVGRIALLYKTFPFSIFLFIIETEAVDGLDILFRLQIIQLGPPLEQEGVADELEPRCHWDIYAGSSRVRPVE